MSIAHATFNKVVSIKNPSPRHSWLLMEMDKTTAWCVEPLTWICVSTTQKGRWNLTMERSRIRRDLPLMPAHATPKSLTKHAACHPNGLGSLPQPQIQIRNAIEIIKRLSNSNYLHSTIHIKMVLIEDIFSRRIWYFIDSKRFWPRLILIASLGNLYNTHASENLWMHLI